MAYQAVSNGIYLVTLLGRLCGQRTMTTFQYRVGNALQDATVQDVYVALSAHFRKTDGIIDKLKVCCPLNWTLEEQWYQQVAPVRIRKLVEQLKTGAGTQFNATVPNLSASITRFGEIADRTARGGIRVPVDAQASENGMLTFAMKGFLTALAQAMLEVVDASLTVGLLVPCIWTPIKMPDKPIATLHDLYGTAVEPTSRVMRRRTVGLGI